MLRPTHLLAGAALFILAAGAAFGGFSYRFEERTDDGLMVDVFACQVWVDGERLRIEIAEDDQKLIARDAVVRNGAGAEAFAFHRQHHTYFRVSPKAPLSIFVLEAVADTPSPATLPNLRDAKISDFRSELTADPERVTVDGVEARRHRIAYSYVLKGSIGASRVEEKVEAELQLWTSDRLALPETLFELRGLAVGFPDADAQLALLTNQIVGVPIQRELIVTRRFVGGSPRITRSRARLFEIREVDPSGVDFTVPAGYAYQAPVLTTPSRTDRDEAILATSSPAAEVPALEGAPAPAAWDTVEAATAHADELLGAGDAEQAMAYYHRAETLSDGRPSLAMLLGMAAAGIRAQHWALAERYARRAVDASDQPPQQGVAHNVLGLSLYAGGIGRVEDLEAAAAAFARSIELNPRPQSMARYNLGEVWLRLGKVKEGRKALREALALWPDSPSAARARQLIDEPQLARIVMAPELAAVTLTGEKVDADTLHGKVVLLDFWATWCKPCVAALPHLRKLSGRAAKEPFALISVSGDDDEGKLRSFAEQNGMDWPQIWDRGARLRRLFDIQSYPTYLLISSQGTVLFRTSGWSSSIEAQIDELVGRSVRHTRKAEAAAEKTAGDP